jgi:Putative peptidoglycan binding domain
VLQRLTEEERRQDLTSAKLSPNERLQRAFDNSPAVHIGESGEAVQLIQEVFVGDGFDMPASTKSTGELDGGFGQETFDVLKAFQEDHGLHVDGIVGRETLTAMDNHPAANADQPLLKPRPGEQPPVVELPGGVQILTPGSGEIPETAPFPGISGIPNILGQKFKTKDEADLARIPLAGVTLKVTSKDTPRRNQAAQDAIRVFGFLDATASAVVLPGKVEDKFTFAFIQVCRPLEVLHAVYQKIGAAPGHELDWNPGERVRPLLDASGNVVKAPDRLGAFDAHGGAFTPMVTVKAPPTQKKRREEEDLIAKGKKKPRPAIETREISKGVLADLFFEDAPQVGIRTSRSDEKGISYDLASFAVEMFFYTALVVRLPSGTVKPLKAFFWQIKVCEVLKPGPGDEGYDKNLFRETDTGRVEVSPIFDCRKGGCFEGELDLSKFRDQKLGQPTPPGESCNEITDKAINSTVPKGPGLFPFVCR